MNRRYETWKPYICTDANTWVWQINTLRWAGPCHRIRNAFGGRNSECVVFGQAVFLASTACYAGYREDCKSKWRKPLHSQEWQLYCFWILLKTRNALIFWDNIATLGSLNFIIFLLGFLANKKQGPGSIQNSGGECIHVLGGGFNRPKDGKRLVLYKGCGESRLEFHLWANGTLMHTRHSMCVKPIGTVTDGVRVGKLAGFEIKYQLWCINFEREAIKNKLGLFSLY
jgi:hypothetical protein